VGGLLAAALGARALLRVHFLEERGQFGVLADQSVAHGLAHGLPGLTAFFRRFCRLLALAGGYYGGVLPRRGSGLFELFPLLGRELAEAFTHSLGTITRLLDVLQGRGQTGIGGEDGRVHGILDLLVDRLAGGDERANDRVIFSLCTCGGQAPGFIAIEAALGRPARLFGSRSGILGGEVGDGGEESGAEQGGQDRWLHDT